MEKVNVFDLLSKAVVGGIWDAATQTQNVYTLFIDGLFVDETGEMKFETVDGQDGVEFHAEFDGHTGMGKTPALAIKNMLQKVINSLYYAEHGRP